jgi:hypothetical protein
MAQSSNKEPSDGVNRRQLLFSTSAFFLAGLSGRSLAHDHDDSDIPPGGTPSITSDGLVQFTYPDGTIIRVDDDRLEIIKPNQTPEVRPRDFHIDVEAVTPPPVPTTGTPLQKWLDVLASDLRATVRGMLGNDAQSNKNYDAKEDTLSLTVYKKIIIRLKYIRRIARLE